MKRDESDANVWHLIPTFRSPFGPNAISYSDSWMDIFEVFDWHRPISSVTNNWNCGSFSTQVGIHVRRTWKSLRWIHPYIAANFSFHRINSRRIAYVLNTFLRDTRSHHGDALSQSMQSLVPQTCHWIDCYFRSYQIRCPTPNSLLFLQTAKNQYHQYLTLWHGLRDFPSA